MSSHYPYHQKKKKTSMLVPFCCLNCTLAIKAIAIILLILSENDVYAENVKIESGLIQGTVEDGLSVYRGIPYAASARRTARTVYISITPGGDEVKGG